MSYAIISINTTGSEVKRQKIVELAVLISDGQKITQSFNTFIHPEKKVPYTCTRKTGIDNLTVVGAPKFYEIAGELLQLLENKTLVGHYIKQTYSFLQQEYLQLGYEFKAPLLCTAKMSRQYFPDLPSYRIDHLLLHFGIEKHIGIKAISKAQTFASLFHKILPRLAQNLPEAPKKSSNTTQLTVEGLDRLPNKAGIYYFYNANNEIIYIGKSKQLKTRVQSHLRNIKTYKGIAIIDTIKRVAFKQTGNDVMALLFEDVAIKKHQPRHNTASKRVRFPFGLFIDKEGPYQRLYIDKKTDKRTDSLVEFSSKRGASNYLRYISEKYELCDIVNGLETYHYGACFKYRIKLCHGACVAKEPPAVYNHRVQAFVTQRILNKKEFTLKSTGRNKKENSFIHVENGRISAFGFIPKEENLWSPEILKNYSEQIVYDNDLHKILKYALSDMSWEEVTEKASTNASSNN